MTQLIRVMYILPIWVIIYTSQRWGNNSDNGEWWGACAFCWHNYYEQENYRILTKKLRLLKFWPLIHSSPLPILFFHQERTKNAQFIIISLRNNMFELADRLVGIYKTHDTTKSVTIDPYKMAAQALLIQQQQQQQVQPTVAWARGCGQTNSSRHSIYHLYMCSKLFCFKWLQWSWIK